MPAADVCWAVASLWQALESGDADRISRIHGPLAALISLQTSLDAFIAIEKHLLFRQGVIPTTVMRQPVSYLLDAETAESAFTADYTAISTTTSADTTEPIVEERQHDDH